MTTHHLYLTESSVSGYIGCVVGVNEVEPRYQVRRDLVVFDKWKKYVR